MSKEKVVPSLRPVTEADAELLLELYGSTRAEELALTNWSDAQRYAFIKMQFDAQQLYYRENFPQARHDVIMMGDLPVGRLYVARLEDQIRILDITVHPGQRRHKIGTTILESLKSEASRDQTVLRIYVESFNPSLVLFLRLGFVKCGETGYSHLLEWSPADRTSRVASTRLIPPDA